MRASACLTLSLTVWTAERRSQLPAIANLPSSINQGAAQRKAQGHANTASLHLDHCLALLPRRHKGNHDQEAVEEAADETAAATTAKKKKSCSGAAKPIQMFRNQSAIGTKKASFGGQNG